LKRLFDTNLPNVKYLLTDNKNDNYVEEWVWNACSLASKNNLSQLDDNPFTYDRMIDYDRDYTALYLVNDKPTYGYFFKKTPQVDGRVIRKLRAYNTDQNNFLLGFKFWKLEGDNFKNNLKPFFAEQGIDTIYFTRHVEANGVKENKWRTNRKTPKLGYIMYGIYGVKVKGLIQNIHYYSTNPSETIHDHSFVLNFNKI
jgi:hypothetical protein